MKGNMSNISQKLVVSLLAYFYRIAEILWHSVQVWTFGSKTNKLPPINNNLLNIPATLLALKIRKQEIKSEDVVQAYIERIKVVNPILNAVVENRFEEALKDAKAADDYVRSFVGSVEKLAKDKPFLGVPFTCKNAIGVLGMIMDAGVLAKSGHRPKEDCVAVQQMRNAGAIPLAITNVPECCMWFDASNKIYGRTKNPYDLTRITGGSSGGEGALITSCASIFGLGNDIGGSIRIPSYSCGIYGHKPTKKIVSNKGQFPSSFRTELDNFNVTGPMCRYAVDLLPTYKVLAAGNFSKLKLDTPVTISELKVFYTEEYATGPFLTPIKTEMMEPIFKVVKYLEKAHGIKAERIKLPVSPNHFTSIWFSKIGSARATPMECHITNGDTPLNIPFEFFKWCLRLCNHTLHILAYLFIQRYTRVSNKDLWKYNNTLYDKLDDGLQKLLGENGVLLMPPQPELPYYHHEQVLKFFNVGYTGIFNILGYPVTQCPMGLSKNGLPLGVQVIAAPHNDHLTLAMAEELERSVQGWCSPFRKQT